MKLAFAVLLITSLIVLGPFITIWSLNTLFSLNIEYSIWTWVSVMWITGIFKVQVTKS